MPIIVDKEKKKKYLISVAADVFTKKGFHATKMSEIAEAAAVAKGTLYEYFATKEDLFLSIYDEWISEYEVTIVQRFNNAEDALERTDAIRTSAVDFYSSHRNHAPLILEFWAHALRSDDKRFLEKIQSLQYLLTTKGKNITEEMVHSGFFHPVDSQSFTLLESGISDGIFLSWVLNGGIFSLEKAYEFRQSLIGIGLLTEDARSLLGNKLNQKLSEGFLKDENS
ncbi:MAG TPA: TetR/AcrR family transcriptional regulator [Candidatus Kapabacteria bacterium]|jgi:AcrR family transcriptional regulator|nr:TetR/AcrR family transcriptional regulator [Candidatus Kapabacteria bacterium]